MTEHGEHQVRGEAIRTSARNNNRNAGARTALRTQVKKFREALTRSPDAAAALALLSAAHSAIDKSAKRGVIARATQTGTSPGSRAQERLQRPLDGGGSAAGVSRRCGSGLARGLSSGEAMSPRQTSGSELDKAATVPLFGIKDANLRAVERATGATVAARGSTVVVEGDAAAVEAAAGILSQLAELVRDGVVLRPQDIELAARLVTESPGLSVRQLVVEQAIMPTERKRLLARTPAQQAYVAAIRARDIVSESAPPGRGRPTWRSPSRWSSLRAAGRRSCWCARPSRRGRTSASCPATSWRRSTRTCGRCSTRCTT